MKCFRHDKADAIGICMACGRGLCRECAQTAGRWLSCGGECDLLPASDRTGQQITKQFIDFQKGGAKFIGLLMILFGACMLVAAFVEGGPGGMDFLLVSVGGVLLLMGSVMFAVFGRRRPPVPGEQEGPASGPDSPQERK